VVAEQAAEEEGDGGSGVRAGQQAARDERTGAIDWTTAVAADPGSDGSTLVLSGAEGEKGVRGEMGRCKKKQVQETLTTITRKSKSRY
jgi:hypothetical protein